MTASTVSKKGTALITGASMGIGLEFARVFAEQGHDLVLVARSKDKLDEVASDLSKRYGIAAFVFTCDLSKPEALEKLSEDVIKELSSHGRNVDILVNNAGFGEYGLLTTTEWDKELRMINVNITALTYLSKRFAIEMVKRQNGKILNVASTAAFQPGPLMSVYFATKAYVLSFSEAIANELESSGITVTALCPGPTTSSFQDNANMGSSKLFSRPVPSSADVARFGYDSLMAGKTVAIHGFMNFLLAGSVRFAPRNVVTKLARKATE